MGKVERPIPIQINLVCAVAVAEVNQNLYQHAQISLENKSPYLKSKSACSIDCVCIGCESSYGIRQESEGVNSKKVPRAKMEDKKYVKERTRSI